MILNSLCYEPSVYLGTTTGTFQVKQNNFFDLSKSLVADERFLSADAGAHGVSDSGADQLGDQGSGFAGESARMLR